MTKNNSNIGTSVKGIRLPIIKPGNDVAGIINDTLEKLIDNKEIEINDDDVIGITESLVARAYNNYVSIDDIANFIKTKYGNDATVGVLWPIYSRNRFSMILKGIARGAKHVVIQLQHGKDEVGNDIVNPWTGIDIIKYYRNVVEDEGASCSIIQSSNVWDIYNVSKGNVIVSTIHSRHEVLKDLYKFISENNHNGTTSYSNVITLADIFNVDNGSIGWSEYGLLGSNKCGDEKLKLFPTKKSCKEVCETVRAFIKGKTLKNIHVMVYGDGCFKDPVGGIWEFADPVSCPYYTGFLLTQSPNEIKIKYIADNVTDNPDEIKTLIKDKSNHINNNKMLAQGTTPRRYCDLLASLCDLTSGSGDKGTPVVLVQNYFKNYAS